VLSDPKPWLNPKSDSLESFLRFVITMLVVVALTGVAIALVCAGRLTPASATGLFAEVVGLLRLR
jgi:hypothetical protein